MILEAAILNVKPSHEQQFEESFEKALPFITAAAGYVSHELHRCVEVKGRYLLLVRWQTLHDHKVGFRGSASYQEWKNLLHHFYEPFPTVEHFREVTFGR